MNFRTKSYLRKRFGDYYNSSELPLPHDFKRREWGFIFFDELPEVVMRRHKAFSSEGEAIEYLRGMVPAHAYHSAAYYQFPGAGTMKEKKWEGADLIFDLDADHLPQKVKSYAEMLSNVKAETGKLLDFLLEDFGFDEENIRVAFSGGRGYHIHVHDKRVLTLESAQRREIVDYLSGTGLSVDSLFKQAKYVVHDTGRIRRKEFGSPKKIISFEDQVGGYGWGKRVSQYLVSYLRKLSSKEKYLALGEVSCKIFLYFQHFEETPANMETIACQIFKNKLEHPSWNSQRIAFEVADNSASESFIKDIMSYEGKARKIINIAKSENAINMIQNEGIVDFKGVPEFFEIILEDTIREFGVQMSAKTDEPVTADIRRLIRMPTSLHGGSGMRVVPLTLSEFKTFEPLSDAVVFSEKEIKIEVIPPLKPQNALVEMKGKSIKVVEGINTVPEYAGIYLMCRGAAEYA
ncbi:MAG: DNA primase small subunit PriS [Candidatus Methanoperedens sp.]|nr:DNA primase small subunit PriS [Candidatus Methanoperedens sp.]